MSLREETGGRLRQLRLDKGLSQESVAGQLSVSRGAYARYEQGRSMPPLDILEQLSELFGVSADYLLGESGEAHPVYASDFGRELLDVLRDCDEQSLEAILFVAEAEARRTAERFG